MGTAVRGFEEVESIGVDARVDVEDSMVVVVTVIITTTAAAATVIEHVLCPYSV